jgi:phosphate:Na+ symporter
MGLLFFPMLKPYATVLRRWMLARDDPADAGLPLYLDPTARENPVIALGIY